MMNTEENNFNLIKKEKTSNSIFTNGVFIFAQDLIQLLTMLVLVRILLPEDYGLFALALSTHSLINAFGHQNFIAYTLQIKEDENINYNDYATLSGIIQIICFFICNIIALVFSIYLSNNLIGNFLHILSLTFLIEWFSEIIFKVYERKGSWKRRRYIQICSTFILSILMITLAKLGLGAWSLVIATVLQNIYFLYDLFIKYKWKFKFYIEIEKIKTTLNFGIKRLLSTLIQRLKLWVEPWLLATFLSLYDLGNFTRALGLAQLFTYRVPVILLFTLFPIIAKERLSKDLTKQKYNKIFLVTILIIIPSTLLLCLYPTIISNTLYGEKWSSIIEIIPILSIISAINGLLYLMSHLILAEQKFSFPIYIDSSLLIVHLVPIFFFEYFSMNTYLTIILFGYLFILIFLIIFFSIKFQILSLYNNLINFLKILVCCLPIILSAIVFKDLSYEINIWITLITLSSIYLYCILIRILMYEEIYFILIMLQKYKIISVLFFLKNKNV